MKTKITFDLIRTSKNKVHVDPFQITIDGPFNWNKVNEFLFLENNDNLFMIADQLEMHPGECFTVTASIEEDSDDEGSWVQLGEILFSTNVKIKK